MGGIGIIHNPFAKGNLKRPWIADKIRKVIGDHGVLRETKNIDELPEVAREFMKQEIEIIAVNGGDGTLHLALTAFANVYDGKPMPKLMSLRGGTMNTMSNSLKIKGKSLAIISKAVKNYQAGKPFNEMEQHLLKVNDNYGFMSGNGGIAKFLDVYYSGSSTGPIQGGKVLGRLIGSGIVRGEFQAQLFAATPMKVTVDGKKLDCEEFKFLLACTIKEIGLGFAATPRAYDKPGHFHLVASAAPTSYLVRKSPAIWLGRDIVGHPDVHHNGIAREVVVEPKENIRWMIDGEMYDTDEPLVYSVGPTITVITP